MQKLKINKGAEIVAVRVVRSWQDASGPAIFQFADGSYAYKNGDPVRMVDELDILGPDHRPDALRWWGNVGKRKSADFYGRETQALKQAEAYYHVYPGDTRPDPLPTAKSWREAGFSRKPDWWGSAQLIRLADSSYELESPAWDEPAPAEDVKAKKKTAKPKDDASVTLDF